MARDFIVVIPVADRPRQLAACLASLAEQRRRHPHAGAVSVLIAEDSIDAANVARHRALAAEWSAAGLPCHHFDATTQRDLVARLPADLATRLRGVLGDGETHGHKGASLTRNLATLWLARQDDMENRLAWFIDSDQTFAVNLDSDPAGQASHTLDYFNAIERLFAESGLAILTGKVVGDPPVSPAVMAATLVADSIALLDALARCEADAACSFHASTDTPLGDAAYHDMAELFGFRRSTEAIAYRCPLAGDHDHAAPRADFGRRLERFFAGEHPTRRSAWQPEPPAHAIQAARTLYTGNYVFDPGHILPFIPFARLRLRMAGPTLGRILRAELGPAFASANLPMHHGRALKDSGRAECRPGVEHAVASIDLTDEFERQYYGDVMLFGMERLIEQGYPNAALSSARVLDALAGTETEIAARYRARQTTLLAGIAALDARLAERDAWWQADGLTPARADLSRFIANLKRNFGPDAPVWRRIQNANARAQRLAGLCDAVMRLPDERAAWKEAIARS